MTIRKNIKVYSGEKLKIKDIKNILEEFSDENTITIFRDDHSTKPGDPDVTVYYFTIDKTEIV